MAASGPDSGRRENNHALAWLVGHRTESAAGERTLPPGGSFHRPRTARRALSLVVLSRARPARLLDRTHSFARNAECSTGSSGPVRMVHPRPRARTPRQALDADGERISITAGVLRRKLGWPSNRGRIIGACRPARLFVGAPRGSPCSA